MEFPYYKLQNSKYVALTGICRDGLNWWPLFVACFVLVCSALITRIVIAQYGFTRFIAAFKLTGEYRPPERNTNSHDKHHRYGDEQVHGLHADLARDRDCVSGRRRRLTLIQPPGVGRDR